MEVRHETFRDPRFVELLRRHDVGLVVADTAGRWPFLEDVTSDFVAVAGVRAEHAGPPRVASSSQRVRTREG